MKHLFLIAALCAAAIGANAEESNTKPRTEANHSVSLNAIGADYAYEHPLGGSFSIIGRAGMGFGLGYSRSVPGTYYNSSSPFWTFLPVVGAEARYYHNLVRREAKGRNTAKNQGGFLSMQARYYFPFGIHSDGVKPVGAAVFTPGWGMRWVWKQHWMFEFNTGVNLVFAGDNGEFVWSPALGVRFGYAFGGGRKK